MRKIRFGLLLRILRQDDPPQYGLFPGPSKKGTQREVSSADQISRLYGKQQPANNKPAADR